jgi:cobaltochelatase CobS
MTTTTMTTRTIEARYAGRCQMCGKEYAVGDSIARIGYRKWVHAGCHTHSNGEEIRPQLGTNPAPTPSVAAVAAVAAIPTEDVAAVVRRLLEGAELSVDENEVRQMVRAELANCGVTQRFEVKLPDQSLRTVDGKPHTKFARVLRLAAARRNILLVGPAGCGKTHLAAQVAEALGLPFASISCSAGMSEGQLLGRLVPTGAGGKFEYLRSDFVKCYEEGGVFLFDELDAADSNTLLVINAALANGHMAIPNRPEKPTAVKHPNFVCIAAANTFGTGADRQYVGRNQLDESTLDRFRIGQIEMDYDAEIEAALCPDDALRSWLLQIRAKVRECKIRRLVSMRFLRDAYVMAQAGDSREEIEEALFAGWTRDEMNKVKS